MRRVVTSRNQRTTTILSVSSTSRCRRRRVLWGPWYWSTFWIMNSYLLIQQTGKTTGFPFTAVVIRSVLSFQRRRIETLSFQRISSRAVLLPPPPHSRHYHPPHPITHKDSSSRLYTFKSDNNTNDDSVDDDPTTTTTLADRLWNSPSWITSTKSTTVKTLVQLGTKRKVRTQQQQTIVEGRKLLHDLLANPQTHSLVQQILIAVDETNSDNDDDTTAYTNFCQEIQHLQKAVDKASRLTEQPLELPPILPATSKVVQHCTDTVTNQGLVAKVNIPPSPTSISNLLPNTNINNGSPSLILVLDGLQDPGNVGTLLRSSVASGVTAVYLLPNSCDPYSPKAIRSAMGTTFTIPILIQPTTTTSSTLDDDHTTERNDWQIAQQVLQTQWNVSQFYAATMLEEDDDIDTVNGPQSLAHYKVDWTRSSKTNDSPTALALILGREGSGLSLPIRQLVHSGDITAVHVPMQNGIESLNAAICGSVILFEYQRQRQQQEEAMSKQEGDNEEV